MGKKVIDNIPRHTEVVHFLTGEIIRGKRKND